VSSKDWLKRCAITLGAAALLASPAAFAKDQKLPPGTIHETGPKTQIPAGEDLGLHQPIGNMMLKNADQINLLNALSTMDMIYWPGHLRKNRAAINDEFIQVMANRSEDAMRKALSSYKANDDRAKNGYVEISFRYALLADLCAQELHKEQIYRLALAEKYARIKDGVPMAMAIVTNILVTDPNHVKARLLSGRIREMNGDFAGAVVDYKRVLSKETDHADAWLALARADLLVSDIKHAKENLRRASECHEPKEAIDAAKKMLARIENPVQLPPPSSSEISPTPDSPSQSADQLVTAGDQALHQGHLEQARKYFQQALALQETSAGAHMGLGDISFRSSDFMKAVDEYSLAAKFAPTDAVPMYYMGLACEAVYDKQHAPVYLDRAIECMTSAVRIKTDYGPARQALDRLLNKKTSESVQ
jgi:tetratricopeptide (TPR) repeat protein